MPTTIQKIIGEDIDNSQGFFSAGNDCAKKIVINLHFRYENDVD